MLNIDNELLKNDLVKNCFEIYEDNCEDLIELKEIMEAVLNYGCSSGVIPQLIYTEDCKSFVKDNLLDILELFEECDITIPYDISQISWQAFELMTSNLYNSIDWENIPELEEE